MMKETEELENKLNEMGALLMKLKKVNKLDKYHHVIQLFLNMAAH